MYSVQSGYMRQHLVPQLACAVEKASLVPSSRPNPKVIVFSVRPGATVCAKALVIVLELVLLVAFQCGARGFA